MFDAEKRILLEEILEMDEGELKENMLLADIEEYNSMAKLSLIVMMEDRFGIKLTSIDIKRFVTVGDILARMR